MASAGVEQDSSSWQTKCSGLSARLGAVLTRGLWTDCELLVGEERTPVRVHRVLLAAVSPVLAAILYGPLADSDKPLHLPDVDTKTFQVLLQYMYTDNVTIASCDEACSLYKAAHYLIIPHVQEICRTFITNNLSANIVLSTYEFGELYGDEEIMNKCLKVMSRETRAVLEKVEKAQASTIQRLFALPKLTIKSELELFKAAEQWVCARTSESSLQENGADLRKNDTVSTLPEYKDKTEPMTADNGNVDFAFGDTVVSQSDSDSNKGVDNNAGGDVKYLKLQCSGDAISNEGKCVKKISAKKLIREAIKEIRFLAMTMEEFASYDMSTLLRGSEITAISLNLMSTKAHIAMPDGFSVLRSRRAQEITMSKATQNQMSRSRLQASREADRNRELLRARVVIESDSWSSSE